MVAGVSTGGGYVLLLRRTRLAGASGVLLSSLSGAASTAAQPDRGMRRPCEAHLRPNPSYGLSSVRAHTDSSGAILGNFNGLNSHRDTPPDTTQLVARQIPWHRLSDSGAGRSVVQCSRECPATFDNPRRATSSRLRSANARRARIQLRLLLRVAP